MAHYRLFSDQQCILFSSLQPASRDSPDVMRVALSLLLLLGAGHPSLSCRADEVAVLGVVGSNGDGGSSKSKVICKGEMGAGSWTGRVAVVAAMYVDLELAR